MGRMHGWIRPGGERDDPGRAVDLEIEHYLAERTEALIAEGWSEDVARREAERRFGDIRRYRRRLLVNDRAGHLVRTSAFAGETIRRGVVHAFRGIRRSPGFALAIIATLGLGVGVNLTMFGVVDRILLRPPDHVAHPGQLRRIFHDGEWFGQFVTIPALTYSDVEDLRTVPEFTSVGAFTGNRNLTLGSGADATEVRAVLVTGDFFRTLGVPPRQGRLIESADDDPGATPTVVLSEEFRDRRFGAETDVLGRTLEISGIRYTIIGIAPRGFTGVDLEPVDVWLPAVLARYRMDRSDRFLTSRGYYWLAAVVRVVDQASARSGEERATALYVNGRAESGRSGPEDADTRVFTTPILAARGPGAGNTPRVAKWLAGVSLAVLLIACANVANLFLARGTRRRREIAVRLSLGGPRSRLLGEMFIEALVLAGLGGGAAFALASWGGQFVRKVLMPDVLWSGSGFEGRPLAVAATLSLGAALLAGLGPAIRSTRTGPGAVLPESARWSTLRRSVLRRSLTAVQAALSVVLLVGAGLFLRSAANAAAVDLGLDTHRLVLASLDFSDPSLEPAETNRLYEEAIQRTRDVPGVAGAAATDNAFQSMSVAPLALPGVDSLPLAPGTRPRYYSVTPDYFRTVGLRLVRGRAFRDTDDDRAPFVAVVSEMMARTLWPDRNVLGQCFYFDEQEDCTTVVGVVEDASTGELEEPPAVAYYLPLAQTGLAAEGLYVRAARDSRDVARAIAPVLRSLSSDIRFARIRTLDQILAPQTRSWTLGASLFTAFGLLALLVAAVGLYSLLAFDVAQRTRDIGIRSALGADTVRMLRDVVGEGAGLALAGALLGIALCLAAGPFVQPLLFHVDGRDPVVLAAVGAVIIAVAGLASLPPAIRATRVDPVQALRAD